MTFSKSLLFLAVSMAVVGSILAEQYSKGRLGSGQSDFSSNRERQTGGLDKLSGSSGGRREGGSIESLRGGHGQGSVFDSLGSEGSRHRGSDIDGIGGSNRNQGFGDFSSSKGGSHGHGSHGH